MFGNGPVDGPKIEDLIFTDFHFEYATSNPDCFVEPVTLPSTVLDQTSCPMSGQSVVQLVWDSEDFTRHVILRAEAFPGWSVEEPTSQVATPTSTDEVVIRPVATLPGHTYPLEVELSFVNGIQSPGTTSVVASTSPDGGAPTSPPHFKVGDPAIYYDVDTTATFSGNVGLCFSWQEGQFNDENAVELYHFDGVDWQPVTVSVDPLMNKVCGQSSSLSPFALFERSLTFTGFLGPVDNLPTRNIANAGAAIPLKFSLNGNQGLNVLAEGYPKSQVITCATGAPTDVIEETLAAGYSGISYNASVDQYTYAWKTNKAWAKSCRRLMFRLSDGFEYSAEFGFKYFTASAMAFQLAG